MVHQFPYVALYRTLLAKKSKDTKSDNFQDLLKLAALHSPNRKQLYHFINIEKKKVAKKEKTKIKSGESTQIEETTDIAVEPPITEKKKAAEVEISAKKVEPKEVVKEASKDEVNIPVVKEAIQEVVEEELIQSVEMFENEAETEEHSFVEWLSFLDGEEVEVNPKDELQEEIKRHKVAAEYQVELKEEIKQLEEEEQKDASLTEEETKAVNKLAEGSITLTTGIVTETLAKIMLMQGKINDAIAMYKALSLKYPEKSNYFAAQIDKIKKS